MSRAEEARRYLAAWDPEGEELPDWVADALDEDPSLAASVDVRYRPWEGQALALPSPEPLRQAAPARWRRALPMVGVGLALAAAALLWVQPAPAPEPLAQLAEPEPEPTWTPAAKVPPAPVAEPVLPPDEPDDVLPPKLVLAKPPDHRPKAELPELVAELKTEEVDLDGLVEEVPLQNLTKDLPLTVPTDLTGALVETGAASWRLSISNGDLGGSLGGASTNENTFLPASNAEPLDASLDMFLLAPPPPPPPPPPAAVRPLPAPHSGEHYTDYGLNGFFRTEQDALSTFSIDVDTASYTMTRRKLREGYLPPREAVRVEEFVNYLPYDYARPPDGAPFGVDFLGVPSPFGGDTQLVRVGVQGKTIASDVRQPVHLTFLVDTSGSMQSPDKIELAKYALKALVGELRDGDTISLVVYAGSAGLVLPPTPMSRKSEIVAALNRLEAGGSTAMGEGIALAYKQAEASYQQGAINRVILLSDGDANVGQTSHEALVELIRAYALKGITLTTAGFGTGNYKDTLMERLANDGDGNYWYIDDRDQARRVFVDQLTSTLVEIARDVKIQVEWNPQTVRAYRLIGYENRDIADRDFRNDAVDAGEIGSGHRVTALYELALVEGASGTLGTVRVRSKAPGPDAPATEQTYRLGTESLRASFSEGDRDLRMAIAAAGLAELLRGSPHLPEMSYRQLASIARGAQRPEYPEDSELIELIERAEQLSGGKR